MAGERPAIVRLFGHADHLDLEFSYKGGTTWVTEVPPDLSDGVYAVELWAVNELGERAYWTGELFMVSGVCHVHLNVPDLLFWVKGSVIELQLQPEAITFSAAGIDIKWDVTATAAVTPKEECEHGHS